MKSVATLLRIAFAVLLLNLTGWPIRDAVHAAAEAIRHQFSAAPISRGDRNGLNP